MGAMLPGYRFVRPGGGFAAAVEVPKSKRALVGQKRLVKGLRTRDEREADRRLPKALVELHARIEAACRAEPDSSPQWLRADALAEATRALKRGEKSGVSLAPMPADAFAFETSAEDRQAWAEESALRDAIEADAERIRRKSGDKAADAFLGIVSGTVIPIDAYVGRWIKEPRKGGKPLPLRTANDWTKIIKSFASWAGLRDDVKNLADVSRRVAGDYVSHLLASREEGGAGLGTSRVSTTTTALGSYWKWCIRRGHLEGDDTRTPWTGQAPQRSREATKRPFTDQEVKALFLLPDTKPVMRDLMALAALTGGRIEELCRLTVAMCEGGLFKMPGTKSEAAKRSIPIHPSLLGLVARRREGKAPGDWLLHELGGTKNKLGERSTLISSAFTRHRRLAKVEDVDDATGQDRVTFHSFRHWFTTKAVEADQDAELVRKIIGHTTRAGDTLGRTYANTAARTEAMRRVMEAVKLPVLVDDEGP